MTKNKTRSDKRFSGILAIAFSAVSLLNLTAQAQAQDTRQGAVSALGRLQPQDGVIRVGAPSTSASLSGSILWALHVGDGDYVKEGELVAVRRAAAV